jgi:hypothetical protein
MTSSHQSVSFHGKRFTRLPQRPKTCEGACFGRTFDRHIDGEDPDRKTREDLDNVLEALLLIELGFETGVVNWPLEIVFNEAGAIAARSDLSELMTSNAFGRYLNTYLFTGVRFLASRLQIPNPVPMLPLSYPPMVQQIDSSLAPPVAALNGMSVSILLSRMRHLTSRQRSNFWMTLSKRQREGLRLKSSRNESRYPPVNKLAFSLWLRGLLKDSASQNRWMDLARGMLDWAKDRAAFTSSWKIRGVWQRWRDRPWVEGKWMAKNAVTARFGRGGSVLDRTSSWRLK